MPYYQRNGYRLYYYDTEKGILPIVFIHGYLGNSQSHWGKQLDSLQFKDFRLIAPDLRGFGRSSLGKKIEKHKTIDHIMDLNELINNVLNIKENPIFVGYSVGATLALNFALKYPKRVHGLVLVNPRVFIAKTIRAWNFLSKEKRTGKNKSLFSAVLWSIVKRTQRSITYIKVRINRIKSKKYLRQLKTLNMPILVISGTKDSVTPKISINTLLDHLPKPQTRVIIYEGDHGITHENPDKFNQFLYDFLNKIRQNGS